MKRLTVFLLFIILIASFLSVILSTNVSTKGADEQEKIKALVAEYPDNFVETEIPYKITYTIASAKSEKYSAQLCFIDNKGQILYSKNGKKIYKSDTEKKLRKIMNVNKDDILDFYDMTQFDGIFYICFMKIVKINALEGSVSNGPYIYYIAETSDFKNYQVHEMETEDSRYIGSSVYLNNAFPYLYKSNDIFYYIYRNCYVSARTSEDEDSLELNIPFGYYGNSLDSLKALVFEGTIDYDHEIFPKGMDIRVWPVIEGSKIRLELYEDHDFRDDIYYNPYANDNFLLEYETSIDPIEAKITDWKLISKYGCKDFFIAGYEHFYTIGVGDTLAIVGTFGVSGQDERTEYSVYYGDNKQGYGNAVNAKYDKNGKIGIKYNLFYSTTENKAYCINNKGRKTEIEFPTYAKHFRGITCSNLKKGWSVIVDDEYIYVSKDGFASCRRIKSPCDRFSFIDIETYGNYLYVLSSDTIYKLKISSDLLGLKSIDADVPKESDYQTVEFGTWNGEPLTWNVLATEDDKMFLLCNKNIDIRKYFSDELFEPNFKEVPDLNWKKSSIREWLNGEFLSSAFTNKEKQKIIKVKLKTDGLTTKDKVFILSEEEYEKYKEFIPMADEKWILRDVQDGYRGKAVSENGIVRETLWLYSITEAWSETGVITRDYYFEGAFDVAVRPAVWIKTLK